MIKQGDTFTQRFGCNDEAAKSVIFEWLASNDVRAVRAVDFMDVPHYCTALIDSVRIIRKDPVKYESLNGQTHTLRPARHEYEVTFTVVSAEAVR